MLRRPRRNRKSPAIREMVRETVLRPSDFIQPFFVTEGRREAIESMPGIARLPIVDLVKEAEAVYKLGIPAVLLFGYVKERTSGGEGILDPKGIVPEAIRALKRVVPELCVIADLALDPFTTHGHDGVIDESGHVLNDPTVDILGKAAVVMAESGVDMVAPSDMMDGRVGHIRRELDRTGFSRVSVMSYSAKYASAFYGPFRDALGSAPKSGDKRDYQMDPANAMEALLECALDEEEGADILMVKPALAYLDVIAKVREQTTLPLAAYHVSGEYSMAMAAAERGWLDADRVLHEMLLSIKRAGADLIISYAAKRVSESSLLRTA